MPAPVGHNNIFEVKPLRAWGQVDPQAWRHDVEKKKAFGAALAKHEQPFQAACAVFSDTGQALWVSQNWLVDPVVIAAKAEQIKQETKLLDKEALSYKLLKFAEEKDPSGRFFTCDHKDRINYLKLYAEIQGYIGKVDINASTNNFTNNTMKIVFVKPENDNKEIEQKTIEQEAEIPKLPLNIKLVSAR